MSEGLREFEGPRTARGYNLHEVISALQKDIRRDNEYQAVYWAVELEEFNPKILWNRLKVIASEDIGIANPSAPVIIDTLQKNYDDFKKQTNSESWKLFLVNAVLFLARSPKSRMVDNLLIAVYNDETKLEIPDYALDKHTYRGRKMGRGYDHFFAIGAALKDQALADPYEEKAKEILSKKKQQKQDIS
jgi:replication-associated recombination protein RarA